MINMTAKTIAQAFEKANILIAKGFVNRNQFENNFINQAFEDAGHLMNGEQDGKEGNDECEALEDNKAYMIGYNQGNAIRNEWNRIDEERARAEENNQTGNPVSWYCNHPTDV